MSRRVDFFEASCSAVGPNSGVRPTTGLGKSAPAKGDVKGCQGGGMVQNRVQVVGSFRENSGRQFSVGRFGWWEPKTKRKNEKQEKDAERAMALTCRWEGQNLGGGANISSKSCLSIIDFFTLSAPFFHETTHA